MAAISVAKCLRTRAVSGFQSKGRAGDARSTLLFTLFTGIAVETGSRETAHTAIDLSDQRQRLDSYRESRPCGAILRFWGPNCIAATRRLSLDFE